MNEKVLREKIGFAIENSDGVDIIIKIIKMEIRKVCNRVNKCYEKNWINGNPLGTGI